MIFAMRVKIVRGRVVLEANGISRILGSCASCPRCGATAFAETQCR